MVVHNESKYGIGVKEGVGHTFYMVKGTKLDYITFQDGDNPVLVAVTKQQYNIWRKMEIVVKKAFMHHDTATNHFWLCEES